MLFTFNLFPSNLIVLLITTFSLFYIAQASTGDQSPYYHKCTERCSMLNCTDDGLIFLHDVISFQSSYLRLLRWTCVDECKYECMWKTVEAFQKRKWRIPQFNGKWPFIRMLGIQEPASVIFSLLNIYVHLRLYKRFKRQIRKNCPTYWLWHVFSAVCVHAWLWSTIFHSRDLPFTEFMDYTCAFSMVLISLYCMTIRLFQGISTFLKTVVTSLHLAFFFNHVGYLSRGIDYGYNMKVNVAIGALNAIIWFSWCLWNIKSKPYVWKCAMFYTLAGLAMILEIFDFPPVFWIFDSHSIWHFSTALITPLFYGFIIDDCHFLTEKYVHLE